MDHDALRRSYAAIIASISARDERALDSLIASDIVDHNPAPNQPPGLAGFKYWAATAYEAFPDLAGTVEDVVVEGLKVAGRVTWRGTHEGPFVGIPATGTTVQFEAFHFVRFEGNRAVEWWGTADLLAALSGIGVRIVPSVTGGQTP